MSYKRLTKNYRGRKKGSVFKTGGKSKKNSSQQALKQKALKALKGINFKKGYLTEKEVNLLKLRLSREAMKVSDVPFPDDGFKLTDSHVAKGKKWLMNQWKTKSGDERKNNPFGYREQAVLEKFKTIKLIDFYNTGHYQGPKFYVPYYEVIATDNSGFQYAVYGGEIHIMG